MASFLNILQQLGGVLDPNAVVAPEEKAMDEIVVTAPQNRETYPRPPVWMGPEELLGPEDRGYSLDNSALIREVVNAERAGAKERRGMFGLKGNLRNALGLLGDTLLLADNKDPIYRPAMERERRANAMIGHTQNPLAASERLAGAGDVEGSQAVFNNYLLDTFRRQQEQRLQAQAEEAARNTQSQIANRSFDQREAVLDRALRAVAAGAPYETVVALTQGHISPEELAAIGITPNMTDEQRAVIGAIDMRVHQQQQLPLAQERIRIAQQNADTARQNASRPRAAPNPTPASIAAPLLRKLQEGGTLTPQELEVLDRLGYDIPTTRRGTTRRPVRPPASPPRQGTTSTGIRWRVVD